MLIVKVRMPDVRIIAPKRLLYYPLDIRQPWSIRKVGHPTWPYDGVELRFRLGLHLRVVDDGEDEDDEAVESLGMVKRQ